VSSSKRCCTPVVAMSVLPKAGQAVSVPICDAQWPLACPSGLWQLPTGFPIASSLRNPNLPVPDLVIAHQALLI
jgi:hypothetical protein